MPLLGCDFSSSPSPQKTIVLALGRLSGGAVWLQGFERFVSLQAWQARLEQGPWVGGFDLPFGLPRPLVQALGWPTDWLASVRHFAAQDRAVLRATFKAFCDARPVGGKLAHRATDGPAGASSSMKWVNPPVAWMLHAGVPRLLAVDAAFPAHQHPAQPQPPTFLQGSPTTPPSAMGIKPHRVALEAYPGLLARELLGGAVSYKSDDAARQTPARTQARAHVLAQLQAGRGRLGLPVVLTPEHAQAVVADASGDTLDALLALVQTAWCWQAQTHHTPGQPEGHTHGQSQGESQGQFQGHAHWGLPSGVDPLEGWIATA